MGDQDGTLVNEWIDDEGERRARRWGREKLRRLRIANFVERQRAVRRWIAIAALADWCAHSTTAASFEAEGQAREVAYRRLTASIGKGEFERDGRSKVLYLDTLVTSDDASPRCRLTREQFQIAVDAAALPPTPTLPITVLNCCWLPANLARQWLQAHGYRSPPYLEPPQAVDDIDDRGEAGRASRLRDHRSSVASTSVGDDQHALVAVPSGFRTNRAEDAERACEAFLRGMTGRPRKEAAFGAARNHSGQALSRKAFNRAWANVAPAPWKQAGRPSKSKS